MEQKALERQALQVQWKTEKRLLTLEKVPVLELSLSYPQISGGSRGGERISRYYEKLAQAWRSRWSRESYWHSCLELAACREAGRAFRPWQARLEGEVRFQDEKLLSIRMDAWEVRGNRRPLQVRTGDNWALPEGYPLPRSALLPRGWKRRELIAHLREQGEARRMSGDCFLDRDFARKLPRALSLARCCRTQEGLEFYIPQCALAPAAEGAVTFSLALEERPSP